MMDGYVRFGPPANPLTSMRNEDQSVGSYVLDNIPTSQDTDYMINLETKEALTIYELTQRSKILAAELQELGSKPGVIIGIVSENCLEFPTVVLATFLTGATVTCFNPAYSVAELHHTFNISKPSIVFCTSDNYEKLIKVNSDIKSANHIILIDDRLNVKCKRYTNMIKSNNRRLRSVTYNIDDTATILYSSGTTGYPKGVMLSHKNIIFILKLIRDENIFDFHGDVTIGTLPMFHAYGMFVTLHSLLLGHTILIMKKFNDHLFLSAIQDYKVKFLYLVPPLVILLLKNLSISEYNLTSVEHIFCGAAPLRKSVENDLLHKYKLKRLQQGYGMTEATLLCTLKHPESKKLGTCGSPINGIQIKVVDIESGECLGPMVDGEICVKGSNVMKGYYRNKEATKQIIDADGWLHTGDVGHYDEDGDFYVVDRIKELIKYKGYQVAPAELEAILLNHPGIKDAAVIGYPDLVAGELPMAFIVRQKGSNIFENDIVNYISDKVSPQKRLYGGVVFTEEIPKNPSGKILRRKLRELVKEQRKCKY